MTLKFYLHAATSGDTGTLPGSSPISTPSAFLVQSASATTLRSMDGTIGSSQTSIALTTSATTGSQRNWFARFLSDPIAAQTISAQTVAIHMGASESNANSNMAIAAFYVTVWRPSTGAEVGSLLNSITTVSAEPGTSETAINVSLTSASRTVQDGDIIVFEVWSNQQQSMGTAYTNTIFFDGTTEDSTTSNAAYVGFTNDVAMYVAPSTPPRPIQVVGQALNRSSNW